jgi:general stress protein 26
MSSSNANNGDHAVDPYKAKNLDNTTIQEKVEGLGEFTSACKFGMMTTRGGSTGALFSRCMALAAKVYVHWSQLCYHLKHSCQESGGVDFIFHTNIKSGKIDDIESDPHVNVSFLNSSGEWASVSGIASIITDSSVVKNYYSSALKAWLGDLGDRKHDGGLEDPRIGIIKVQAKTATYAISRKNALGRAAGMAQGIVTGNVAAVNKLRELSEEDIITWRASNTMVQ